MQGTLVDAFVDHSLDGGSSPPASTKQSNTKILSNMSLGDVKAGAFVVLRVEIVLSGDVPTLSDKSILRTGFPAQNAHQGPFFSFCRLFLFFLWTFAFRSKGGFEHEFGTFRNHSALAGLE